jgi:Family of unknown function (DUF5906)
MISEVPCSDLRMPESLRQNIAKALERYEYLEECRRQVERTNATNRATKSRVVARDAVETDADRFARWEKEAELYQQLNKKEEAQDAPLGAKEIAIQEQLSQLSERTPHENGNTGRSIRECELSAALKDVRLARARIAHELVEALDARIPIAEGGIKGALFGFGAPSYESIFALVEFQLICDNNSEHNDWFIASGLQHFFDGTTPIVEPITLARLNFCQIAIDVRRGADTHFSIKRVQDTLERIRELTIRKTQLPSDADERGPVFDNNLVGRKLSWILEKQLASERDGCWRGKAVRISGFHEFVDRKKDDLDEIFVNRLCFLQEFHVARCTWRSINSAREEEREFDRASRERKRLAAREEVDAILENMRQPIAISLPSLEISTAQNAELLTGKSQNPIAYRKDLLLSISDNCEATSAADKIGPGPSVQTSEWQDPLDFQNVPEQEAVARVNAAGLFVHTLNGDIYKIEPGGRLSVQRREGFNNIFASRLARLPNGRVVSAGQAWKNSFNRAEYDHIGYWPGNHGLPAKAYNLWRGWGIEASAGDWSVIRNHIYDVMANGNRNAAEFILNYCAHMVQRPCEKPGIVLVFTGRKGTGKTLFTEILARMIGAANTLTTADGKRLLGQFNWHLADKLLILAEEAFFVGNREQTDQLKHLITGNEIEIEQKYGQRFGMRSFHRLMMNSNHDHVVAATEDERRFVVCRVSDKKKGDYAYFDRLSRVARGEDDATLAAFMHELQTRDIKAWNPEQAARAVAGIDLAHQILLSLDPPLQWLSEMGGFSTPHPVTSEGRNRQRLRADMLDQYRNWAKNSQVRGATDFTGAEVFWNSIRRLLNNEIFPGIKLFRNSGGQRWVMLPSERDLREGFNRLLGAKVFDCDEE